MDALEDVVAVAIVAALGVVVGVPAVAEAGVAVVAVGVAIEIAAFLVSVVQARLRELDGEQERLPMPTVGEMPRVVLRSRQAV